MQEKRFDGTYGEPKPLTQDNLKEALEKKTTKHVEVFEATEEEMKYRQKLFAKGKRFQKTGSIKKKK